MKRSIVDNDTEKLARPKVQETQLDKRSDELVQDELVQKVKAAIQPVREDLVRDLQARIKNGNYEVPSEAIAANILDYLRPEGDGSRNCKSAINKIEDVDAESAD